MTIMTGQEISKENGLSTWKLLGLTIITGGVFFIYWMKKMTELVEEFSGERVWKDSTFIVLLFICYFLLMSVLRIAARHSNDNLDDSVLVVCGFCLLLLSCVAFCMQIQWSFKARRTIRLYAASKLGLSYKINAFYTLIFNVFYINYCLNDLGDEAILQHKEGK